MPGTTASLRQHRRPNGAHGSDEVRRDPLSPPIEPSPGHWVSAAALPKLAGCVKAAGNCRNGLLRRTGEETGSLGRPPRAGGASSEVGGASVGADQWEELAAARARVARSPAPRAAESREPSRSIGVVVRPDMTGLQPAKKLTPFSVEALLADVVTSGPRDVQEAQVTSSSSNVEPDLCLPPEQALHWGAAWFTRSSPAPGHLGECLRVCCVGLPARLRGRGLSDRR